VVRGYLIGSGWKDYQATAQVCGIACRRAAAGRPAAGADLHPATKAAAGEHDENIDFDAGRRADRRRTGRAGARLRCALRRGRRLRARARHHHRRHQVRVRARRRRQLYLIDEALTPDSSRFWPADLLAPGISPPSFDKQFVRDYLETLDWDKQAPGPGCRPKALGLAVVLVAPDRLGVINHVLLTAEAIRNRGLELALVVLNACDTTGPEGMDNAADLAAHLDCPVLRFPRVAAMGDGGAQFSAFFETRS
jgi:hypothetical protein